MGIQKFLVFVVFFALLMWGPMGPFGIIFRVAYLIVLPTMTWFALKVVWRIWQPDSLIEDRLFRVLAGATAVTLLLLAFSESQRKFHSDCTSEVQTRDGSECVGDYVNVPGPDWANVALLIAAGLASGWLGINHSRESTEETFRKIHERARGGGSMEG